MYWFIVGWTLVAVMALHTTTPAGARGDTAVAGDQLRRRDLPIAVRYDPSPARPYGEDAVLAAITLWNESLDAELFIYEGYGSNGGICAPGHPSSTMSTFVSWGYTFGSPAMACKGSIILGADWYGWSATGDGWEYLIETVVHELGHVLGLEHSDYGVMGPWPYGTPAEIHPEEIRQVAELWGLDVPEPVPTAASTATPAYSHTVVVGGLVK